MKFHELSREQRAFISGAMMVGMAVEYRIELDSKEKWLEYLRKPKDQTEDFTDDDAKLFEAWSQADKEINGNEKTSTNGGNLDGAANPEWQPSANRL